ncbi:kinase-like domain-containing protein [Dichotomocladium elegans]|nr:kinase-like domain-containing protein [Dichotomocladium elegans]
MPFYNPSSPAPQRRIVVKPQSPARLGSPSPPNLSPLLSPDTGRRRKDIGDYWLGKTLGKGSSGRVKLGIHKVTGEKVAIKIISKAHLATSTAVERAVKREIAIMKLIHHPNIMGLLDVIDLSDSPNLYLILEYVQGGELFDYLVSQGRLSEPEARKYFQQVIFGLDYCHRHLICHRDLKPENLLLDKDHNIKIADFGMASLQPAGALLETSCGSPHYASPEIVNGVPYNGSASDVWSCGIILYALLCGHLPFDDDDIRELLNKVKTGKYRMPDHISIGAQDLLQRILVVHPEKRITAKVQEHPWFKIDTPLNPSILPDPPTAEEIGRPVSDSSKIDDRLLETLKVLWSDLSAEQVVEALLNEKHNMQKVTYVLLQRHANNYWQTERDDDIRPGNDLFLHILHIYLISLP